MKKNLWNFWGFFRRNSITVEPQMTQLQTVMMHLKRRGSITAWQAINEYNITRLSAIVFKLKRDLNMDIESTLVTTTTKKGNTKRYTIYTLTRR
jgi:hypothetical protein